MNAAVQWHLEYTFIVRYVGIVYGHYVSPKFHESCARFLQFKLLSILEPDQWPIFSLFDRNLWL